MTPEVTVIELETNEKSHPDAVHQVALLRWKMAIVLSLVMVVTYFAFVLGIAFDKAALGALLTEGLSLGIVLGAGVIIVAFALTAFYAWWANRVYDPKLDIVAGGKR